MANAPGSRNAPPNEKSLGQRIRNEANANQRTEQRLRIAIANTVIGQMLPPGVVKGGASLTIRVGEAGSRFSYDLDVSRMYDLSVDDYIDALRQNLSAGWGGFSGRIVPEQEPAPPGIPPEYIMKPFSVRLDYRSRSWIKLPLELGRDEVGSTENSTFRIAPSIAELFGRIGLPEPAAISVLKVEHQIVQKLHACTGTDRNGNNDRAHDLVDIQLLMTDDPPDLANLNYIGQRLFAARQLHTWPPQIRAWPSWTELYQNAAEGLPVLSTVEDAVAWTNDLIRRTIQS